MSELLKNVDARTKLAGTNKLEILMFTLGEDTASGRREVVRRERVQGARSDAHAR